MVGSLRRAVVLKITISPSSADIASRASEDGGSWRPSNPGNLRMDAKVSSISTMAADRYRVVVIQICPTESERSLYLKSTQSDSEWTQAEAQNSARWGFD